MTERRVRDSTHRVSICLKLTIPAVPVCEINDAVNLEARMKRTRRNEIGSAGRRPYAPGT